MIWLKCLLEHETYGEIFVNISKTCKIKSSLRNFHVAKKEDKPTSLYLFLHKILQQLNYVVSDKQ